METPHEVVQDCLASLRKADMEAFAAHLPEEALRHVHSEHWVAGHRAAEGGPLAQCSGEHLEPCAVLIASRLGGAPSSAQASAVRCVPC